MNDKEKLLAREKSIQEFQKLYFLFTGGEIIFKDVLYYGCFQIDEKEQFISLYKMRLSFLEEENARDPENKVSTDFFRSIINGLTECFSENIFWYSIYDSTGLYIYIVDRDNSKIIVHDYSEWTESNPMPTKAFFPD